MAKAKAKAAIQGPIHAFEAAASLATEEAHEILECIEADLEGVAALVERERSALLSGKRLSNKRLARLRLVAQDLDSAHRLAGRTHS